MASILIIDDNESFRSLLEEMLAAGGHSVKKAADGLEGAQLYREGPTDLILTDIVMPHSGLTTIRVLRDQFPGVKIIAMSGGGAHRLDYARSSGAACTLRKPFSTEQLAAAISEALVAGPV
jgi:CheY-like chemotaxis protein